MCLKELGAKNALLRKIKILFFGTPKQSRTFAGFLKYMKFKIRTQNNLKIIYLKIKTFMNKKFLKFALTGLIIMFVPMMANAQVTIGSVEVPRATLDVVATDGTPIGIIAPHATRTEIHNAAHGLDQHGAIVFVTDPEAAGATGRTEHVRERGYHWFDAPAGSLEPTWRWRPFGGGAAAAERNVLIANRIFGGHITQAEVDNYDEIIITITSLQVGSTLIPDPTDVTRQPIVTIFNRHNASISPTFNPGFAGGAPNTTPVSASLATNMSLRVMWVGTHWVRLGA